jgi:hypothetical protein
MCGKVEKEMKCTPRSIWAALPVLVVAGLALASDVEPVEFPELVPGDSGAECAQLDYAHEYSCKIDEWTGLIDGDFECPIASGDVGENTITIGENDGTYFDWAARSAVGAVIVKGGNTANVYRYDPQASADTGLHAPLNPNSGNFYEVSHVSFCWNEEVNACEWIEETAWAGGDRYIPRGNWATYTPYVPNGAVTLYAGQELEAGTVSFSEAVDGVVTITIELNEGFRFADDPEGENVKIQGYDAPPPRKNPEPGQFKHKFDASTSPFPAPVPASAYYGVHIEVEWEFCPEDET